VTDIHEIRQRLAAIANVDWSTVKRERDEEYYGDWIHVGPVLLHDVHPEDELPKWREQMEAEKRQTEALVAFVHHAADDIRTLLEQVDRSTNTVTEYGQLMAGGGYHVRNPHPDIERIYPLAEWIAGHRRHGGQVHHRRLIVMEDWMEVDQP
jgi:hypothetical protein